MNKKVLIFLGLAVVALIVLTLYTTLGGFEEVPISIQAVEKPNVLAGVPFEGNMRDATLDSLYEATRQLHQSGKLKGTLGALYEDLPLVRQQKGEVKTLVGVWLDDPDTPLPAGFQLRKVPGTRVVRATLQSHFLVAPSPNEVQFNMRSYAQKQGLQTESFLMEKYLSDRNIILEAPIK